MSMTIGSIKLSQSGWTQRARSLLGWYRQGFQQCQRRARLQDALYSLSSRELHDIGRSRGEIEHVAEVAAAGLDPRPVDSCATRSGGGQLDTARSILEPQSMHAAR